MKNKIFFCICTKNRKLKLFKNLQSILRLKDFQRYDIEVILVSNDRSTYNDLINKFKNSIKINLYKEITSGVVFPRNRVLKILRKKNFDYAAFIDDDCILASNWLNSMIAEIKKNADIITGPQFSKSKNIYSKIMERHLNHRSKVKWASTNNVFFKSSVIKNNVNFEKKLNNIGGEDQLFFSKLLKLKKKCLWNSHAPVYELEDKNRENFNWFFRRNLRYGASSIIIYRLLYGTFFGNIFIIIKVINDVIKMLFNLFKFFISKKNLFSSLMYLFRIFGVLVGLCGYQIKQY